MTETVIAPPWGHVVWGHVVAELDQIRDTLNEVLCVTELALLSVGHGDDPEATKEVIRSVLMRAIRAAADDLEHVAYSR